MVSSIWLLLLFFVPATILDLLVAPTIAQGDGQCTLEAEYCWKCSGSTAGSYTDGSMYQQNLKNLLSSFSSSDTTLDSGFYDSSLGDDPDKVNAIALCRGDLELEGCRSCVTETTQILLQNCSNDKEAIIWARTCMVRYSQNLIFGIKEEKPVQYVPSQNDASNAEAFRLVLTPLLEILSDKAALGDFREKFAAGHATVPGGETIYALVQCTPDIDKDNCIVCLKNSITFIQGEQVLVAGARVYKPSCSLRYEGDLFYESTADSPVNVSAPATPTTPETPAPPKQGIVIGLIVGGCIILVVMALVLVILWKKRESRDKKAELLDDKFEKGAGPRKFSYKKLVEVTNDFAEKLGEGGFGAVYKGFIKESNLYVAVKRIKSGYAQGLEEYAAEVTIISQLRHRNLVQLIGWCHEKEQLLLVYEFMPNGSLDLHLFNRKSLLTWKVRYKIAHDLASGLLYLHQGWEQCVLHRDIKSSNVMLDSNFDAKLGDFGLARLVDHGKESPTMAVVAGTKGYMAPEYITTRKASKDSDVYSFGVVALEIASGRIRNDQDFVSQLHERGQIIEAADPKLHGDFDKKQMIRLMLVGLWCARSDPGSRPSIQEAIQALNDNAQLPNLTSPHLPSLFYATGTPETSKTTESFCSS